jgi:ATP-dependent helicase/nuclease subunit A
MVAARIHEIMDHPQEHQVWDGKTGSFRDPEYRDIVILLRTMEGWAGQFSRVLNQEGIPAYGLNIKAQELCDLLNERVKSQK